MTGEEKAEEYVANIPFSNNGYQIFYKDQIKQVFQDGARWGMEHAIEWHDKELETTIKNYQKVINELMGTQLTDTEEVSRLINIAHYQKWEEL